MTWYHYIDPTGTHTLFEDSAITRITGNAVDGTQNIILILRDGTAIPLSVAQVQKIVGAIPAPL